MPAPLPNKTTKPNALEIFTDRLEEQQLLAEILSTQPMPNLGSRALLTQFYGVGGVGKSTLYLRALEIAAKSQIEEVVIAATCFDDNRWGIGSPFTEVVAELCRCLVDKKIIPELSVALLAIHGQQVAAGRDAAGGLDVGWNMAFTALEKGADLTGIPGLGMVVKGARWVREQAQRQALRQRLVDLGLWPEEAYGRLNFLDLEKKLSSALYYDLVGWLGEHPRKHVRFLLDGFERLQSSERKDDAQRRLQEFIGFFAGQDNNALYDRFRVVIFGRNMLRWDEIYEDSSWREFWNLHILGGLGEADARDFLKKTQTWFNGKGQTTFTAAIQKYEERILDAADETTGSHRVFYPFYLKLAVELVERAQHTGKEFELGRAPAELQDRFFRYLDPRELRALMVLSISGVFDEGLFNWLAKERLIEYAQHSFHSQLRREHSYIQAVEGKPGEWRFHRIMEDALHARWHTTAEMKQEGAQLLKRLIDHHATLLASKPRRDWSASDNALWRRGMEMIVKHGVDRGLLEYETWSKLVDEEPWVNWPLSIIHLPGAQALYELHPEKLQRLDRTFIALNLDDPVESGITSKSLHRAFTLHEKILGPDHPDTLYHYGLQGRDLEYKNDLDGAEEMFWRSWNGRKKIYGPEHPVALEGLRDLRNFLRDTKGDITGAEELCRIELSILASILAPDFSNFYDSCQIGSLEELGRYLREKGDFVGVESLYRNALAACEKVLGADDVNTHSVADSLACTLENNGDLGGAEALHRKIVTGCERSCGLAHPRTLAALKNLREFLNRVGGQ